MSVKLVKVFDIVPVLLSRADGAASGSEEEMARDIFDESQGLVPVATGELKGSGSVSEDEVSYDAAHAAPVEYGTRYQSAQPYLYPAVENVQDNFVELLKTRLFLGGAR